MGTGQIRKFISINTSQIAYTDMGSGDTCIVLLHGYLESSDIWKNFTLDLSRYFRVISFDIPGHGQSDTLAEKHSMEILATSIYYALKKILIDRCFMIGHSMGGYVTMMFHELYPEKLSGFSLFHSHPYADTKETRKKRLREIELVKDGKKDLIAKVNIPNAFADSNHTKFNKEIQDAIEIALKTPSAGIIANLHAMMNRPDLSKSLKKTKKPFLLIAGKQDSYIHFKNVASKIKLPKSSEFCVLEKSGHMGFVEEKKQTLDKIIHFLKLP